MAKDLMIRSSTEEFITFKLQEKEKGIQVRYENETLWMTQKAMAELFDTGIDNINVHLKNIYDSNELDKDSTIEENSIVQKEGNRREIDKLKEMLNFIIWMSLFLLVIVSTL